MPSALRPNDFAANERHLRLVDLVETQNIAAHIPSTFRELGDCCFTPAGRRRPDSRRHCNSAYCDEIFKLGVNICLCRTDTQVPPRLVVKKLGCDNGEKLRYVAVFSLDTARSVICLHRQPDVFECITGKS